MKVKVIIALTLSLMSFGVFSQNAKIITQSNASPMQDLFSAEKLPEGYEWLMIAPVINNINGYIKVALPSNIMNDNASTDNSLFSESKIKTNIFSIKLSSLDGKTAEFQKGTFFLTNSIKIAPPQKCYLDFNEFKKDKGFKNADLELGSKTTFIKFTPKRGELRSDGNIVVGIDKIHCGVKSYGPWVDLTMYGKPVYCAVDFAFACAKADEVSLIKNYMPLSANYLAQGYTNPAKRDLLNEIRPDGSSAVTGDKNGGIPITIFNDLETIEKFENSKESMHDLFNRVTASSTRQAIISLAAMHEVFDKGSVCGEGRKKALVDYVKSNIPKYYEQIALVTEEAIDDYIKVVPCGKYFFEPSIVEQNSKEFNLVIGRINQFCKDAFVQYSRKNSAFTSSNKKLEGADDLSFMDRGMSSYATFSSKASKNMEILKADADKVAEENMGPAQFLLQQLMATNYFKFFYAESFSDYVGKFDLKRCVEGDSALNGLEMQPIPNDPTRRFELLKTSAKELMAQAVKSINALLEIKNTIVHSTIDNEELSNHEDRKDKLVDYLLSYTLSFKQYKSIAPASSREFLVSTKLIGEVLANDQSRANWNKAIGIGASIIAVAGGILAITGIGAPAGSLLTAISATINSWAVLTVTTATVMVNAGVNWDKAVTEEEFARMAGSIDLRLDEYNYNDLVKAIDAKESAVSEAVTNIAFLALPVGAYKILKTFPKVSKVLGLGKVGVAEENAFKTFDLGVKRYGKANVSETEFGTLLSANKEDDALFKSILGKADKKNLDKITKKASSINNQQDYDVFMNNIRSSIDDTGNINFSKILKSSKSEYSFINDIKLIEQRTALDEFLNNLDSRGIKVGTKEYDVLMSSFEKTHKAKGNIMDLSSDKYIQYSKLREEYSNILSNNKVPNALKTAREDLKPLLDTGVLGEWEDGKFIGGRFFVPDKTGKDLYVRPGNNQLYKYNDHKNTMDVLPGQISANANNISKVYGAQIQNTKDVLYVGKNRYVPTETGDGVSYYRVGDAKKDIYYKNPATGIMETKQSVLVRARMPILKEKALPNTSATNQPIKDLTKNAAVNEGPKEFLPKNYYQDQNVTLLTTGVNDFTKIPTGGSSEIYTVNRTFLNNLKDNPAALEKGFKYYVDKDHNVHFFDFDGPDVHSSVFAKKGIPEIADAGWVTKMGSEGTIQVNGRNSKFNSKEFMIDYIKNKDPEFFKSSGFADKGLVSINKANLDPKDFGANKLFKVEQTNLPLEKKTWPEYENSSIFGKDKLRNKDLVELDTEIIDGALTTGEMEKYGLKFYIDEKGDITLSSVLYDHDQMLQKHFLNKKDLLDYGYIQLTKRTVNGEELLELNTGFPRSISTFKTGKYVNSYVKKLYSQEGKTLPFIEHDGKLYYKPSVGTVSKSTNPLNKVGLDPKDFGAHTVYAVQKQRLGRMPIDENYWKEYTSMSVFGKENRSFRQPHDLNTKILEDALDSGELSKFKMKHYIDQDGNISVSSIQFEHSEILQGYFLEQKDLLDYGYIELGQEHLVNGVPSFEIKTSAPRIRTTGLSTEKYFPEYIKKLYAKEGKKMPFIEHEGKLYYVPKTQVNVSNAKYWTNGKPKPETYQRYNDYGVSDNLAPTTEYKTYDNVAYQKLNTNVTESLASDAKFIYDKPEYTNIKEYKFYINDKGEIYLQRTKSPHNYILSQEGTSWFGAGDMNINKPTMIDNQLVGKVYFREAYGKEFMSKQYIMDSLEALYKAENKKFPFKKIGSDYFYVY